MKRCLTFGLGVAFSATALAQSLPTPPSDCAQKIATQSFCSSSEANILRGPVDIKVFAVVDKAAYPSIDAMLKRYTAFDQWPSYVAATGRSDIVFNKSAVLPPLAQAGANPILRHYADYKIDSVIGYQDVRSVSHNQLVTPYTGALTSLEFKVQNEGPQPVPAGEKSLNGSVGVRSQVGSVHVVDCARSNLCPSHQYLLIYESTVTPAIDLLPQLAARAMTRGLETILIGMFLLDDMDDDIL